MEKLVQQIIAFFSSLPTTPKDWVLKLLSLFFALFLWYFVVGEDKVDMNVSIPIEIVNMPRDLVISNQFKKNLDVAVSGQRSLIRNISSQQISKTVDLSNATPGTVVIRNEPDSINFPWGISVLRIQPSNLTLVLDRLIQKELPVRPILEGALPAGITMKSVTPEPATISISGPEGILKEEEFVKTKPLDISSLKTSDSIQVTLDLKPAIADLIGEPAVTVHLQVLENKVEQLVTDIPVLFSRKQGEMYSLNPATVSVKAEFPLKLINEKTDLNNLFTARVDLDDLASASHALLVKVTIPGNNPKYKGIRIMEVSPETVRLEISQSGRKK